MIDRYMSPSIEDIPGVNARAAFSIDSASVFREQDDLMPVNLSNGLSYMPWGADNQMPYNMLSLIESDETVSTCLLWNAQMCYGSGLHYNTDQASRRIKNDVTDWMLDNSLPAYFLGTCQDLKHWGFAVTVLILSNNRKRIARILRKEAMYCRFSPAKPDGTIANVYYAQWRNMDNPDAIEVIPLLNEQNPYSDLLCRMQNTKQNKFAIVTRTPTADHTYYPIPYYAALFIGKWYNIKKLIGMAKEAKLKNSAPIKYHVEISDKYWDRIFRREGITDRVEQQKRINLEKQNILDFLTGAENSGKTWFSSFYVTPDRNECHDVKINKIDAGATEGGDWSTDIQEAVNMICFTMQVHSNLVGSVPGKSQSNNSGSDKRELYTIAQALQKPYHDLMFLVHNIIIKINGWTGVSVDVPFIQLTTLDENKDAKSVTINPDNNVNQ
mgnify:CR=1 FL=1